MINSLTPAASAFDAIAHSFDTRFGSWHSVAAQRRAVRATLQDEFRPGAYLLELGGGTGEDASFLAERGFKVLLTDPSPSMVGIARTKLEPLGSGADTLAGENLNSFAAEYLSKGGALFDGVYSNFAPLNCVLDLRPVAHGLAQLLKPDAPVILVLFGTLCPGEMLTELMRGRPSQALRRFRRGKIKARLAKHEFQILYHSRTSIIRAFTPWFVLEKRVGIGVTVPPSSAEPWISRHPRLLNMMEILDRSLAHPLAMFGDHVLYQLRRTNIPFSLE